ncbi:unnamed protein product, partial [Symbiodinium sp. CCMP2456]
REVLAMTELLALVWTCSISIWSMTRSCRRGSRSHGLAQRGLSTSGRSGASSVDSARSADT